MYYVLGIGYRGIRYTGTRTYLHTSTRLRTHLYVVHT